MRYFKLYIRVLIETSHYCVVVTPQVFNKHLKIEQPR